jgi:hypothetical protein
MKEDQDLTPENGTEQVQEEPQIIQEPESEPTLESQQEPEPKPEETVDFWKNKATEQATENIVLNGKVKKYESRGELTNQPTETELRAAFPTWEFMTETEKDLSRRQLISERKADLALAAQQKRDEDEKWNNSLEFAITSNPDLSGKERDFKEFASKPTHRGAPVDVLVDAFLHKSSTPTPKPTPRQVLEPGSGGPKEPVTPKKVTLEEAKVIRETDYKRYMQLVKSGQIEEDL